MVCESDEGELITMRFCEGWRARTEKGVHALVAEHVVLRALCDRLEAIADGLPGLPPAEERRQLSRHLTTLLPPHQARESELLQSLLPADGASPVEHSLVERIRDQHVMDAVHAQDLGAALEAAGPDSNGDTLGYMLRCFFDGCRRAMAFEELALLRLAGRRLSPAATSLLTACLRTGTAVG